MFNALAEAVPQPSYSPTEWHQDDVIPHSSSAPHLETHDLTYEIDHGSLQHRVLDEISLPIHRGAITALIGPSGCGKTSFLKSLNRLTDLEPAVRLRGKIHFDGLDLLQDEIDTLQLRRRIGMIFQRPNPFPLSIQDNLALPLKEHGVRNRTEREARIETALKDVGLWQEVSHRLHDPALSLSGGQQQRLCIARALVLKPEMLLMDEPCSALDPMSAARVEELISELRFHYSVVVVTHNLAQARRIADYVGVFWLQEGMGNLIEFGAADQVFNAPQHSLTAAYISGVAG